MPNARKGIVFSIEVYTATTRLANNSLKGSSESVGMSLHEYILGFKEFADHVVGVMLFICQFWVLMNLPHVIRKRHNT
jgi:hypothetical protein